MSFVEKELFEAWFNNCVDMDAVYRFDNQIIRNLSMGEIPVSGSYGRVCATASPMVGLWFSNMGVVIKRNKHRFEPVNYSCFRESPFFDIEAGMVFPQEAEFYSTEGVPIEHIEAITYFSWLEGKENISSYRRVAQKYGLDLIPIEMSVPQVCYQLVVSAILTLCAEINATTFEYTSCSAVYHMSIVWSEKLSLPVCRGNYNIPRLSAKRFMYGMRLLTSWCERFMIPVGAELRMKMLYSYFVPRYFTLFRTG